MLSTNSPSLQAKRLAISYGRADVACLGIADCAISGDNENHCSDARELKVRGAFRK